MIFRWMLWGVTVNDSGDLSIRVTEVTKGFSVLARRACFIGVSCSSVVTGTLFSVWQFVLPECVPLLFKESEQCRTARDRKRRCNKHQLAKILRAATHYFFHAVHF